MDAETVRIHRSQWGPDEATIIPNDVARDRRLSRFTVSVLAELLSRKDEWPLSADRMWHEAAATGRNPYREGRTAYRLAFQALKAAGYGERFNLPLLVAPPRTGVTRKKINQATKRAVWDRDGWECVECGSHRNLTVDHKIPLALCEEYGIEDPDGMDNLQTMCRPCNIRKGAAI